MKKMFNILYSCLLIIIFMVGINVHAATPTLEEIADNFNNSTTSKQYAQFEWVFNATAEAEGNKITINMGQENIETFVYTLEGNILTATFEGTTDRLISGTIVNNVLVGSIGQFHGYSEGELTATINSEEGLQYTVEEEGYEIKEVSENNYLIKIDISKKIPLAEFKDTYIEVEDLTDYSENIAGDGFAEFSKGNVWFNKNGHDGHSTVIVAEKNDLTDNAYKSIQSIIEVMFGSKDAVTYFTKNYPKITSSTKEFKGIKIEVNPTKTEFEKLMIPENSGFKILRITIDNKEYEKAMANPNSVEYVLGVPDTAKSSMQYLIIGCLLVMLGSSIVFYILTKRTMKQELN